MKTNTEIIFRKNLVLGCHYTQLYKLGSPFRVFFHPRMDLQAFHYRNKRLGNFNVKYELLASGGKFCAAIYFLDGNLSILDIKNALRLKYLTLVNINCTLEKCCITDPRNNQLFLFKTEFDYFLIYTIEGFFENVLKLLSEEIATREKNFLIDTMTKLINEI